MAITSASGPDAAPRKQTLSTNYLDFTSGANDWAQQYLPDLMEKESEIYGNRTISGFLSQIGAEEASQSDSVVWSEQGRLHLAYTATNETANAANVFTIVNDVDGNTIGANHGIRVGDQVLVAAAAQNKQFNGYVSAVSDASVTILSYTTQFFAFSADAGVGAYSILVYGSEFGKGKDGRDAANSPNFKSLTNKHIILKDYYEVSGSDTSAIGWVEVSGEEGQSGYLWYLKAEGDTRARFSDYLEMSMMEAVKGVEGSSTADGSINGAAKSFGTEGLFAAITARGHITDGLDSATPATNFAEFDSMLATFDKNGAIEENMMFLNRATALKIDDMLGSINSAYAAGSSFGVFNNSEDMALNLGFSGFRRGSYDFYKSDWKYLNDQGTRGFINASNTGAIRGAVIPAGVSTVYDEQLGKNLKRPFLHVRYRSSETDDRKLKTWVTGSVGATTSGKDVMEVHYLSERCLVTQGANNFMLIKG
jgi:hypothetical protein